MKTAEEKYGAAFASACGNDLEWAFGDEWSRLEKGRAEVLRDFADFVYQDNGTAVLYLNRIGAGNLQHYANTMLVRARNGWALLTRARRAERIGRYDIAALLFLRAAERWPTKEGADALRTAYLCCMEAVNNP